MFEICFVRKRFLQCINLYGFVFTFKSKLSFSITQNAWYVFRAHICLYSYMTSTIHTYIYSLIQIICVFTWSYILMNICVLQICLLALILCACSTPLQEVDNFSFLASEMQQLGYACSSPNAKDGPFWFEMQKLWGKEVSRLLVAGF